MRVVKRSSVAGHADFFQRRRIGLLQRKILGTGMKLLYDRRGPRTPINFLKVGEQWQERLNELPWSEDVKAGENPGKGGAVVVGHS
jgi:hypothetical protein